MGTLKNPLLQELRNLIGHFLFGLTAVRHTFAESMTEITIGYPDSPLNGKSHHGQSGPKPGERVMPSSDGIQVGAGPKPLFALFAERTLATTELMSRFPDLLEASPRSPVGVDGMLLVRPDGYACCKSESTSEIMEYLENLETLTSRSIGV